MNEYIKTCKYCGEINESHEKLCKKCGRVIVSIQKQSSENQILESIRSPVVIACVVLFFSLFLPWFAWGYMSVNAFLVAKFFRLVSQFSGGSGSIYSLINILIYIIPIGCIGVVVITFLNGDVGLIGTITGALPVLVMILLFMTTHLLIIALV